MTTIDPKDLPAWIRGAVNLRTDKAQWPVAEFLVNKWGAYGATRTKPAEGWCPSRVPGAQHQKENYPCRHWGADLSATEGSDVVVPRDGYLLYLGPADKPPFVGYGPAVALIAHYDIADSMWGRLWKHVNGALVDFFDFPEGAVSVRYSLIGHMDMKPGPVVELPADVYTSMTAKTTPRKKTSWSPAPTKHWRRLKQDPKTIVMMSDADAVQDPGRKVFTGQLLGYVSAANHPHIHWEIRSSPLADKTGRFDPIDMWRTGYKLALPGASRVAKPAGGGGGGGILLLLAALALGGKKKRGGARQRR